MMQETRIVLLILFLLVVSGCSNEDERTSNVGVTAKEQLESSATTSTSRPAAEDKTTQSSFAYFLPMDEELIAHVMVSDTDMVGITRDDDNALYQIKQYSFTSKRVDLLWETDQDMWTISFDEEENVVSFPVNYDDEEDTDTDWLSLDLQTHRVSPRAQSENPVWTLLYEEDGIWGENKRTTDRVHWTHGTQECCAYWLDGGKQFVYIDRTGATIADGSGYEQLLKRYDIASGTTKTLLPEQQVWRIVGWLEPGRNLIVDHAFNEGVSINYTALYVVDLAEGTEQPLGEGLGDYGNYSDALFSEKAGKVILQKDAKAFLLDVHSGELSQLAAWEDSEQGDGAYRKYAFSPNGRRLAYHVKNTTEESTVEKLYVSDQDGNGAMEVLSSNEPLQLNSWSPSGQHLLVQVSEGMGLVNVMD